jgi:hypothetical protein
VECDTFDGVKKLWPAEERREAEVPARGLFERGLVGFVERGRRSVGVICGASVVKRRPVERPIT